MNSISRYLRYYKIWQEVDNFLYLVDNTGTGAYSSKFEASNYNIIIYINVGIYIYIYGDRNFAPLRSLRFFSPPEHSPPRLG